MDTNKMREQFEAWHSAKSGWEPRHYDFYWNETYYEDEDFQCAWEAWQASREAVMVELPPKWNSETNSNMQWWDQGIEDARMAIEAQGLKVAP
ncbi:hypothetical protein Q1Z72_12380 [Pseudomonas qingdaonensis]|uniref:hypothetical protein n=1 Tax=Pseudomonas qingdaonensis TaxID=2056231 RepID=UPI00265F6BE2|nr:hypothetical protein [Pseudomonas qingdaonensis]WKL69403.1 hypothetical protein Q1Z72_12380 [Pseudomonas qingdaonensis]